MFRLQSALVSTLGENAPIPIFRQKDQILIFQTHKVHSEELQNLPFTILYPGNQRPERRHGKIVLGKANLD